MKILYFDCFAGIAGDMTVAALLELGVPFPILLDRLAALPLSRSSFHMSMEKVERRHVTATMFNVHVEEHQPHRHYGDLKAMIEQSSLTDRVKELSQRIFRRLAEAEAKVHGVALEEVHFHEVGAVDSIVDIVGTAVCLDYLEIDEVYASPLPFGSGFVETAHGRLPVPAPATAELLTGLPVHFSIGQGERVTPTGAAIIAALANVTGTPPAMRVTAIGCGAGSKDFPDVPNILRVVFGEGEETVKPEIFVLETHIDDMNPEILGFLMDHLLELGALDVAFSPLQMKKNRPGTRLTLLCHRQQLDRLSREILHQSTAIGVRYYPVDRMVLDRRTEERETSLGAVQVKVLSEQGKTVRIAPEYAECRRLAEETGLSLLDIYRIVERETAAK